MALRSVLLPCALALFAMSCSAAETKRQTQLILVADTDIALSKLDAISFHVEGPQGAPRDAMTVFDGDQRPPATLGLVHTSGPLGPMTVTAKTIGDGPSVSRTHVVSFVAGRQLVVPLHLAARCVGDETCAAGGDECAEDGCVERDLDSSKLEEWQGAAPGVSAWHDGGTPNLTDASPNRDGGADGGSIKECGGSTVDTDSNVDHCGGCFMPCKSRRRANVTCEGGTCRYECQPLWDSCDQLEGEPVDDNGCETHLTTAINCGACGVMCKGEGEKCSSQGECVVN